MSSVDSENSMHSTLRRLAAFVLTAVMLCGLAGLAIAQSNPPKASVGGPPPQYTAPGSEMPAIPAAGPETAAEAKLPMLYVTSVEVLRTSADPRLDIVRVTGLASSQGWSDPELVPTFAGKPLDDVLDLQLIATSPLQSQPADGFVPMGAVFTLEENHPFKGVRVRASENTIEVKPIPGLKQADITVDSCKDCIGKKFAERGQGPAGQAGVARQEDLPKILRWIIPSRGIRGITHNPNRLNLILGDDNTIVQAFWE
jgi:hypothetical protein